MKNSRYSEFTQVLTNVQNYITNYYTDSINKLSETEKIKQLKSYIEKYLQDNEVKVENYTREQLIQELYSEMSEYSILTEYLNSDDVEEININAYNDIKISFTSGKIKRLENTFRDPNHALDIVKRLLQKSKMTLDNAQPIVVGHLSNKIRITAIHKGVVDDDVGVACSIRIVNPKGFTQEDFVKLGTATNNMLNILKILHKYKTSMVIAGETGGGKTTLLDLILDAICDGENRVFTIENNTREMDKRKFDVIDGKQVVTNNVVHTKTKHNDDKNKSITMEKLLETALTFNPDFICVGEMKSAEAFFAQEASRSGHAVSTTTHAKSCRRTYHRMMTLSKLASDIDTQILLDMMYEAFPIIIHCKKLSDNTRRITEITECELIEDERGVTPNIRTLYKFDIEKNIITNGKRKVIGSFKKVNNISDTLKRELLENGILEDELNTLLEGACEC